MSDSMRIGMDVGAETLKSVLLRPDGSVEEMPQRSIGGQPLQRVIAALREIVNGSA